MDRALLQQLAEERIREADSLLAAGCWSGAFYLAGYAVECALKACIAKRVNQYDFPDRDFVQKCYSHKPEALLEVALLIGQRNSDAVADPALNANWNTVRGWSEQARYRLWTESDARQLFEAVTNPRSGVLPWIMARW